MEPTITSNPTIAEREFKFIPEKKYGPDRSWYIFGLIQIGFGLLNLLPFYRLEHIFNATPGFFFVELGIWCFYYGLRANKYLKRTLEFHFQYYRNPEANSVTETFCRRCGITITNKLFKNSKKKT